MKQTIILSAVFSFVALSAYAKGDKLIFICHKGLKYSAQNVRRAYRAQLDEPAPVDNKSLKSELLEFLGVDAVKYKKAWDRNFFRRALNSPKSLADDAAVISYVAEHSTGIGYVSKAVSHPDIEVCGE